MTTAQLVALYTSLFPDSPNPKVTTANFRQFFQEFIESVLVPDDSGAIVSQAEAEAGVATTARLWTAERIKQAILALAPSGGNEHFKGTYLTEAALNAAHPTATDGDYANIDPGSGTDVLRAIWDANDAAWVVIAQGSGFIPTDLLTDYGFDTSTKQDAAGTVTNGSSIAFDLPRLYGQTTALTGAYTVDTAGAKIGQVAYAIHNDTEEPTHPTAVKKISGEYVASVNNHFYFNYINVDRINLTISQDL